MWPLELPNCIGTLDPCVDMAILGSPSPPAKFSSLLALANIGWAVSEQLMGWAVAFLLKGPCCRECTVAFSPLPVAQHEPALRYTTVQITIIDGVPGHMRNQSNAT